MTIEQLGSLGEFLGSIAVLATLIYLAIQIRQNTKATRAQIHQARSDQAQDFFLFVAGSPEFSALLEKVTPEGKPDLEAVDLLTPVERRQLQFYLIAAQQRLENMYFQRKWGFLAEETYSRTIRPIRSMIPLWRRMNILNQEGEYLDELLRIEREGPGT